MVWHLRKKRQGNCCRGASFATNTVWRPSPIPRGVHLIHCSVIIKIAKFVNNKITYTGPSSTIRTHSKIWTGKQFLINFLLKWSNIRRCFIVVAFNFALEQCFSTAWPQPGTGPSSYIKKNYRAAVSQRLRTTDFLDNQVRVILNGTHQLLVYVDDMNLLGDNLNTISWYTMLQTLRLRIRFPMRQLYFFNLPTPSSPTMTLGSTQPLTEMSTRKLLTAVTAAGA
jgi:hypothetical protein